MAGNWKFSRKNDLEIEKALGRDHYWHYGEHRAPEADNYLVKVIMKKGDKHDFHRHPRMNEILYILKGRAEQWVEDEMQILEQGDSVYIDSDVVHAIFNDSDQDLEFLAILGPSSGWEAGTIDESQNLPYSEYRKT